MVTCHPLQRRMNAVWTLMPPHTLLSCILVVLVLTLLRPTLGWSDSSSTDTTTNLEYCTLVGVCHLGKMTHDHTHTLLWGISHARGSSGPRLALVARQRATSMNARAGSILLAHGVCGRHDFRILSSRAPCGSTSAAPQPARPWRGPKAKKQWQLWRKRWHLRGGELGLLKLSIN
jgi:hypothetical protein